MKYTSRRSGLRFPFIYSLIPALAMMLITAPASAEELSSPSTLITATPATATPTTDTPPADQPSYEPTETNAYIGLFAQYPSLKNQRAKEEGLNPAVFSFGLKATRVLPLNNKLDALFTIGPGLVSAADRQGEDLKGWMLNIEGGLIYHINDSVGISYGLGNDFYNISKSVSQDDSLSNSQDPDLSGASYATAGILFNARNGGATFGMNYRMMKNSDYENHISFNLLSRF